jgi:hypothetical protein
VTSTVDETAVVTAYQTVTFTNPPAKRQVTVSPSNIPWYADVCQNVAGYKSACSCLGVTPSIVTVSQPVETSTVTATVTPYISIIYTTYSTLDVTTTDSTIYETVTYSTEVVSSVITTVPFSTIDATSTLVETVTATVTPPNPVRTFDLIISYSGNNAFTYTVPLNGAAYFINPTTDPASQVQYSIDSSTGMVSVVSGAASGDLAFYSQGVGASSFILVATQSFAASQGGTPIICSVDSSNHLNCQWTSTTIADYWLCGSHLYLVQPGYDFTNSCNQGTATKVDSLTVSYIN